MKKIFLLSLLSVFFLSAFCQFSSNNTEVLAKIDVTRTINAFEYLEMNEVGESPELGYPSWWFLYKTVKTEPKPGGGGFTLICNGKGWKLCFPNFKILWQTIWIRGIAQETIERTCENLVTESEELAANGVYVGSTTKKIAFFDPEAGNREAYLLFQMNWNYNPENPYNGTAEIIISKTNKFGLR
ncbi:MAG: hypothetical protein FWC34_01975 [Bacteroidetes bacterium]|nr:hypothetical protein [Bacteroidota bacterium]MCL2303079.1 hypothetical protein [Lentimicrobiaceae bacterium]